MKMSLNIFTLHIYFLTNPIDLLIFYEKIIFLPKSLRLEYITQRNFTYSWAIVDIFFKQFLLNTYMSIQCLLTLLVIIFNKSYKIILQML
jgi:hypothetical protein